MGSSTRARSVASLALLAGALAALAACDDVPFAPAGPLPTNPTICYVAARVFEPSCATCHGAGGQAPELTAAAAAALVSAPSPLYPGEVLVVASDPQASLLYRKLVGPPAQMPLGEILDPALTELVRAWIAGGALTTCASARGGANAGHLYIFKVSSF